MPKENFINYRNYRWFWVSFVFMLMMSTLYILSDPIGNRRGDTGVGYFLGGVSTLVILIMMWFGRRKRSYSSTQGTVIGWLSAHVWIGLTLLFLVPLHSGFQFDVNIHSLAYVLMVATIFSGIWGGFNYVYYPDQILSNRGGDSSKEILGHIFEITRDIEGIEMGKSDEFIRFLDHIDQRFSPRLRSILFSRKTADVFNEQKLSKLIMDISISERDDAVKAVELVRVKRDLVKKLKKEVSINFYLKIWLFFHVPLAFGLCVALAIHIFSVFYYW